MELSNAGSLDLKYIRDLYRISFPDVERKPFSLIERKAAMGTMEILLMSEGRERMGLAITASDGELVLLDYFAVDPSKRGQGAGSEALQLLLQVLVLRVRRNVFIQLLGDFCPQLRGSRPGIGDDQ